MVFHLSQSFLCVFFCLLNIIEGPSVLFSKPSIPQGGSKTRTNFPCNCCILSNFSTRRTFSKHKLLVPFLLYHTLCKEKSIFVSTRNPVILRLSYFYLLTLLTLKLSSNTRIFNSSAGLERRYVNRPSTDH
jgi:hypothetical protein